MKRFLLVLLLAPALFAQDLTLTSPVARGSVAKVKIGNFSCTRSPNRCTIDLFYTDASDVDLLGQGVPLAQYVVPSLAAPDGPCTSTTSLTGNPSLLRAMANTRSGETGNDARIMSFRILGYLSDRGCFAAGTLNP